MTRQYDFEIEGKETFSLTTEAMNPVILLNDIERDILRQLGKKILFAFNDYKERVIDSFRIIRIYDEYPTLIFTISTVGSESREEVRIKTTTNELFRNLKSDCYYGYEILFY